VTSVERARALGVAVAPRAEEIEELRHLPDDVVDALKASGLCKLFVPAVYGGGEESVAAGVDVLDEVAYHDGSTGWCVMIAMTTGLMGGFLPADGARELFADPGAITGGFAAPVGQTRPIDGGYSVAGQWQWGSGINNCTAIGGGCRIVTDDGVRGTGFAFFDLADVDVLDTWHVAGLRGTGSTDYVVRDVFVPERRFVALPRPTPVCDGPLYRFSVFGVLAIGIASVMLGISRRGIDELVALASAKTPQGSNRLLAERTAAQAEVATAEAEWRGARAFIDDAVGEAWEAAVAGDAPSDEQRRLLRLAATHASATAARVVDRMYTLGGGAAIFTSHPLQRVFRDVHVATQHAMTAPRTFELSGRMRLGLETDTRQL
jgi:alkylation response protein AidB-like acyl-CoA dehydrogenase